MHGISPLKKWLIENHLFTPDKNYTHLLLDGGKLNIPQSKIKEFYHMYCKDYIEGYRNYICECKTPIFKFHVDLDFFQEMDLSDENIIEYVKKIQEIISDFFYTKSKNKSRVYICLTQPSFKEKSGKMLIKTGIHLIWPEIYTDKDTALILRKIIIYNFQIIYGERTNYNIWEDVVDESVYRQNGLRMIGSAKINKCKECRGKNNTFINCQVCFGKGRVDEGRIYLPKFLIKGESIVEVMPHIDNKHETFLKYIRETSIQVYECSKTKLSHNLPDWINKCIQDDITTINKPKKNIGKQKNSNIENKVKNIKIQKSIEIDSTNGAKIINYIKTTFPQYKNELFKDIHLCGNNSYYIISTNSHYCMNVNREHNNNHIYFHIDKNHIYQKCFSTNISPDQKYGPCKSYRSKGYSLNKYLKNVLYNIIPNDISDDNPIIDKSQVIDTIDDKLPDKSPVIDNPLDKTLKEPQVLKNTIQCEDRLYGNDKNNKSKNVNSNIKEQYNTLKTKFNKNKIEDFLLILENNILQKGNQKIIIQK